MKISEMIDLIRADLNVKIYRTIAPMDESYPFSTIIMRTSEEFDDLQNSNIDNENVTFTIGSYSDSSVVAESTDESIRNRLRNLSGTSGDWKYINFNITSRYTEDYVDEATNKLIFANKFDVVVSVRK